MTLSQEDKNEMRALVRGEINKTIGTIISLIEKNPTPEQFRKMITQVLIKAQLEAEAATKTGAARIAADNYVKLIAEDAKLETFY